MRYFIVGGVAGGATAAARIRRIDEKGEIVLLERGEHISYANCGLPYYIGGVISDRERLLLQTPEGFGYKFNIDVRVQNEVVALNTKEQIVTIRRADGSEYEEHYDRLLLSPGAKPVVPPLEGIDRANIFTLRNVADMDRIKNFLQEKNVRRAVVIGAGFIGLEMAENLHHAGVEVSIVEMAEQVLTPIDFSMAAPVHEHLVNKGVHLFLKEKVTHFSPNGVGTKVHLASGKTLEADMILLSIGVRPEVSLAQQGNIRLGETGGIWVDEYLQTSAPNVYAVGDAIEFPHPITRKPWLNFLANPANRQGRIVADNMVYGNKVSYEGAIGTAIAKVFDMTIATTGLPAKKLKQLGIPYLSSWTHGSSHAGYYPDALPITIKLVFDPTTGRLFGAQAIGYDGVDKRIDQAALVIKSGGTIYDLISLEHTYAPPFSSAKDPLAIAGYVASNIISGAMSVVTWRDMPLESGKDSFLLDVRLPEEYALKALKGAVNIPLDDLRGRLAEIPKNKKIYIYCVAGLRGYLALKILRANGFKEVYNLSGGYKVLSPAIAPTSIPALAESPSLAATEPMTQNTPTTKVIKVDACGLQCPGPVLALKKNIDALQPRERIEITATDAGFARDAQAWCNSTGNILVEKSEQNGRHTVLIEKGQPKECSVVTSCGVGGKTFVMFSDDLDKALATFVLANGAAATGAKVTIFFTFWGLNVIKKERKPRITKDIFGKMFGMMLPKSSRSLALSKMNMFGMGARMMRLIMKKRGIDSLEMLRRQAIEQGVEFIACQMSMDVMGVAREELLDNVSIGGVATYMERADDAHINLFI